MTPLVRFLRNTWEKLLGKWYEGPDAPRRLGEMAIAFANMHPHATRAEWARFATELAGESYRSGWVRGVEYTERARETWFPEIPPEELADQLDPDWRWSEDMRFVDPQAPVIEPLDPEATLLNDQLRELENED